MADNAEVVRGIYEAFAKGDAGPLMAALDEKVEWNEAEHITFWPGGPFIGPQAVAEGVLARIPQTFDDFRIDLNRITGLGDTVLVEARYRGVAKATGKPLDAQVAHVWDFRDGKVVKWQQYSDTWHFELVTGETPKD